MFLSFFGAGRGGSLVGGRRGRQVGGGVREKKGFFGAGRGGPWSGGKGRVGGGRSSGLPPV